VWEVADSNLGLETDYPEKYDLDLVPCSSQRTSPPSSGHRGNKPSKTAAEVDGKLNIVSRSF
jgi:hypothetical protein